MPVVGRRNPLTCHAMEWFANNWPMLLIGLGVFIVLSGVIRKVAKLAFFGIAVGVLGLIIWPMVSASF